MSTSGQSPVEQSPPKIAPPIQPPPPSANVETGPGSPQGVKRRRGRPKKVHTIYGPVSVRDPAPRIAPSEREITAPSESDITTSYPASAAAEAQYKIDMQDSTGIRRTSVKSYTAYMRRWKEFCERHHAEYAGADGRSLYLVDSEDKVISFFKEDVFSRKTTKRHRTGADFRTQIGLNGEGSSTQSDKNLAQMLKDAPTDRKGRKMIDVPIGSETIMMARKAMIRIHEIQLARNEVSARGPRTMSVLNSLVDKHKGNLFTQGIQSGQRRTADCVLGDSYSLVKLNEMMTSLWEEQQSRDYGLNYRDMFCISVRHNMLLRDEDLRHLNFSDCFSTIITQRHEGGQQPIALTFKLNKGKTNKNNRNWYACALRHNDVRRCCFSAFAFYMFQMWQGSEHKDVKQLAIEDVQAALATQDWHQFKVIPSPSDPKTGLTAQTTHHAVDKSFDKHNIYSSKKTHGGRHAGTIEAHRLGIRQEDIKDGGRWTAERGRMESFYMSSLPTSFALGMAGFYDKPLYLPRNSVKPSLSLQRMVFPWIEDAYGKDNSYWRSECTKEMNEVDPNIVPGIGAARISGAAVEFVSGDAAASTSGAEIPSTTGARPPELQGAGPASLYTEEDVAKSGFLRLLVRCRRIILQDAAYRLHHKQDSKILHDDIFQSTLFQDFLRDMSVVADTLEPDPLQKYQEAIPAVADQMKVQASLMQQALQTLQAVQQSQQKWEQQHQSTSTSSQGDLRSLRQQMTAEQQQLQQMSLQQQQFLQYQQHLHQLQLQQQQVFMQQMLHMSQNGHLYQAPTDEQLSVSPSMPSQTQASTLALQVPLHPPFPYPYQHPSMQGSHIAAPSGALPPTSLPQSKSEAQSKSRLKKSKHTTWIPYEPKKK